MTQHRKHALFDIFERAVMDAGWRFLLLSGANAHPRLYTVFRDRESYNVLTYIWNVTHGGGKARPANEYRIQITGIANLAGAQQFKTKKDTKTLVLGWWDDIGVFCGFDVSHHLGPLGKSPSLQIGKDALETAHRSGFSIHNKGNGELALAFQPEFVCTYIKNLETLHDCGTSPSDLKVLGHVDKLLTQRRAATI